MSFNYLNMIWDVKIFLAKIKDGKGRDLYFPAKKSLLTTIRPKFRSDAISGSLVWLKLTSKYRMKMSEWLKEYFHFSRRDRIAVITLTLLIVLVFFSPRLFSGFSSRTPANNDTTWVAALKRLEIKDSFPDSRSYTGADEPVSPQYDEPVKNYYSPAAGTLFYFDPNTISAEGWKKLGLREKTIHTIQNYLSKGGHFRKPDDLKKIYGLFPDEYERIAPYINIAPEETVKANFTEEPKPIKPAAVPKYTVIDINVADTTAFISLPGVGSKLSARIVNFREKLGGFYSINQIGETYGLPDSTFQRIKPYLKLENNSVKKISINTVTADELKTHPYIRYAIANPIIAYRKEHGPFAKIEDIKKVMAVTEEVYQKIAPYLTIQ